MEHDYASEPSWEFLQNGRRHIVTYSHKRARKAQWGRERSVSRLEKLLVQNKAVRKHRFLDITLAGAPRLNPDAIAQAAKWDGIKGYVTNTTMTSDDVIARYTELYRVEQTFRMSKSDLRVRPAFHRRDERIRVHFLLCMVALCVMRLFETLLRPMGITLGDGVRTLEHTKSGLVNLRGTTYAIPPEYSSEMTAISDALATWLATSSPHLVT